MSGGAGVLESWRRCGAEERRGCDVGGGVDGGGERACGGLLLLLLLLWGEEGAPVGGAGRRG